MRTHHVHFPVRYDHEHRGVQEREHSQECSNRCRCASPTRIRTHEIPDEIKRVQQRTRADKGPERNVYAVAPASHIVATEYRVAHACVQQSCTQIDSDVINGINQVVAEPYLPNVTFTLGRDPPQKYRQPAQQD